MTILLVHLVQPQELEAVTDALLCYLYILYRLRTSKDSPKPLHTLSSLKCATKLVPKPGISGAQVRSSEEGLKQHVSHGTGVNARQAE